MERKLEKEIDDILDGHSQKDGIVHEVRKDMLARGRENLYKDPDSRERNEELQKLIEQEFQEERLLSIDEAATLLGVTQQTLRNWEKKGKLVPTRTEGSQKGYGHRRYTEKQINEIRKVQMAESEIILYRITPLQVQKLIDSIVGGFDPLEPLNVTIRHDSIYKKVRIIAESRDGMEVVTKSFNLE